jgi:tetratricopeptide (TPR) repeat protein
MSKTKKEIKNENEGEELNSSSRCPVCGAALTAEARKKAAARAVQFIKEAKKQLGRLEFRLAASLYSCAMELATEAAKPKTRAHAYWGRGECYEALGERESALLDYEDAHKIDPDDDVYLSCMAELRAALDHEKRLEEKAKGEK